MHVQLLCAERNTPCQWDLAIDKAKPLRPAARWQGNDQTDLQCQATRHCHQQIQWATCLAPHWGSWPHSEGEKAPLVWTCGTLQWCSQDSLWHTGWWKAWAWEAQVDTEAAEREGLQSGSSWLSTLMIDIPRGHPTGRFGRKSLPKLTDFSLNWPEGEVKMNRMYREIQNLNQNFSLKSWNCRKTSPSLKGLGWPLHTQRFGVRSAMHAASQLPIRRPTDVNVAPIPAC